MAKEAKIPEKAEGTVVGKMVEKFLGTPGAGTALEASAQQGTIRAHLMQATGQLDTEQNSDNSDRPYIPQQKWDKMKKAGINVKNIMNADDLKKAEELMTVILASRQDPNQMFVDENGKKSMVHPIFLKPEYKHLLSTRNKDKQKSTDQKQDKKQGKDRDMSENKDDKKQELSQEVVEERISFLEAHGLPTTNENIFTKFDEIKKQVAQDNGNSGSENNDKPKDQVSDDKKKEGNDGNSDNDDKSQKPLNVDGKEENKENQNVTEIPDWVKKKMQDYQSMADKGEISNYTHDESVKDGFAASFNGGGIHYTSPDNVSVSPNSGLKVYETLLTEPDNKGRAINFGESMSHEQAVLLMTAALIHGNPLGTNIPQLTPADLNKIEQELKDRPEDLKKFKEGLEKLQPQSQQQQNATQQENNPQGLSEEKKGQVKEALNNQYELAKLQNIKNPVFPSAEARDEYTAKVKDLTDKQDGDKKLLIEVFRDNPEEFRSLLNEVIKEKTGGKLGGLNQEQIAGQAAVRQSQIDALREKMGKTEKLTGDALKEDRTAKIAERNEIIKANLGITEEYKDSKGNVHKPLEGEARTQFIENNKVSEYTYTRLGGKDKEVAKTCADKNPITTTKGNERQ